jgi:hypothetical protein
MNTINLNEYMNSVYSEWNSSNEPILAALGKKGAPRIDFGNRIYGAKGIKSLSNDFRHFKCSQLRECNASLTVLYGEDGKIIMPIQIKKSFDHHHECCFVNTKDDYINDIFLRYVENRVLNETTRPASQLFEESRGQWVTWASTQEPKVVLPLLPEFGRYATRFVRLRRSLNQFKTALSISEVMVDENISTHSGKKFCIFDYPGKNRILLFASPDGLKALSEALKWHADGTFYTRTKYFGQLWVIHGFFPHRPYVEGDDVVWQKRMIPCVWAFTARRRTKDYIRLLTALNLEAESNGFILKPTQIMLDFELAAARAFKFVYPQIKLSYCHFHLGQSLFRKVRF